MDVRAFIRRYSDLLSAVALAALSLLYHVWIFRFGAHPFGYDTGFYRRFLIEPATSLPSAAVPGLGDDALGPRLLLDLLRLIGQNSLIDFSPDIILYGSYLALFAALPVLIYVLLSRMDRRIALTAGVLVALSSVQYEAYWFMYWKSAFALCLLFLALIALERRSRYLLAGLDIAIALSHKTTAALFVMILGAYALLSRRLEIVAHIILTASVLALVALPSFVETAQTRPSGMFLDWFAFFELVIPFLILIAGANRLLLSLRYPMSVVAFSSVVLLYPILHLPFYERVFLYADVALCIFAAAALICIVDAVRARLDITAWLMLATVAIAFGLFAENVLTAFHSKGPLIPEASIERIERIGALIPEGATLLTTSNEAPWYEGWTSAHIAAPGMLRDTHSYEEWEYIWGEATEAERIAFLGEFDHPLYISTLDGIEYLVGTPPSCLRALAPDLLVYECQR